MYARLQLFEPVQDDVDSRSGGRSCLVLSGRDDGNESFAVRRDVVLSRGARAKAPWASLINKVRPTISTARPTAEASREVGSPTLGL